MRRLVIETATDALSLALFDQGACIAHFDERIGRGHAERLIPEIADLPDGGRAEEIWVDVGPGSFTGVRIGIAAARALGIAWRADVLGVDSAAMIAASARALHPELRTQGFAIAMDGGHGEWLVGSVGPGAAPEPLVSLNPEIAIAFDHDIVLGSRAEAFVALRGHGTAKPLYPAARHAATIEGQSISARLDARYARPPDATPLRPPVGDA